MAIIEGVTAPERHSEVGGALVLEHAGVPSQAAGEFRRREPGTLRRMLGPVILGVALLAVCAALLLLMAPDGGRASASEEAPPSASTTPAKPAWLPVIRPIRLILLEAPELAKTISNYEAVRSTVGDGREDSLSFGSVARIDAPFMRIAIYRAGAEAVSPAPFFVELSRRAAFSGLSVTKIAPSSPMQTKFGEMETAETKLVSEGTERSCVAFRHGVDGDKLRIFGWYCASVAAFVGKAALSCVIDRLSLISAGEDNALRDAFVVAERQRAACAKAPMLAATAPLPAVAQSAQPPRLRGTKTR